MMNIEKRSNSSPETPAAAPEATPQRSKKPVIIYIMILFIVAFLLMALSFVMHQRSNTEAMGQLQDSVNAMQAVQATQEKVISLQESLSQAEDHIDKLNDDVENLREELEDADAAYKALFHLYTLQQQYASQNYETCKVIIATMEETGMVELLPKDKLNEATAPFERYEQLKDAVLTK